LFLLLTSYGVPGILVLVGMLLLGQGSPNPKTAQSHPSVFAMVLVGGICSLLVANLIDFALFEPAIATCMWAMAGCLIATSIQRPSAPAAPGRRIGISILGTLGVIGACGLGLVAPVWQGTSKTEQARKAIAAGDFDQAHRLLDQATATDRLSSSAASLHGRVYLQQYLQPGRGDQDLLHKAIQCLVTATGRNPADFRDYEWLGDAYDLLGRPDQAYEAYDHAVRCYPACDRLWLRLGQMSEKVGRPQVAAGHYAKAVEIEEVFRRQFASLYPDWKRPVSRLGEEDYRFARQRLQALVERHP
jgi:tetratricopeptide (TPR) repeat protein